MNKGNTDKLKKILFALAITCFVVFPYFSSCIYNGHDLQFHLSRIEGVWNAMADKQFPLAIYPNKNFGYGYASPLFYSDLYLIIPSVLLHVCHLPVVRIFKLMVFACVFFANLNMMRVIDKIFHRLDLAVFSAFLYTTANYFVTDIFIRAALGEILSLAIFPLFLDCIYDVFVKHKDRWVYAAVIFALLAHAHLISCVLAFLALFFVCILYAGTIRRHPRILLTIVKAGCLGFGLTCIYFMPMLEQYFAQDLIVHHIENTMLQEFMVPVTRLAGDFFSDFRMQWNYAYGVDIADRYKNLGCFLTVLPLGYLAVPKDKHITRALILYVLVLLCSSSLIPLYRISAISFLQFPSRLYTPAMCAGCLIIAYTLQYMEKKKLKYLFLGITVLSVLNLSFLFSCINDPEQVRTIDDHATTEELFTERKYANVIIEESRWNWEELAFGEYLPQAYYYDYYNVGTQIDDLEYQHTGIPYERSGTTLSFTTDLSEEEWILLPVSWYKGYQVYETDSGGKILDKVYTSQHVYSGRIQIHAQSGIHHYLLKYTGTKLQKLSAAVSVISLIGLLVIYLRHKDSKGGVL